jgi:hypothetical protein
MSRNLLHVALRQETISKGAYKLSNATVYTSVSKEAYELSNAIIYRTGMLIHAPFTIVN